MEPEDFYPAFCSRIKQMKPHLDATGLDPDTHLWAAGYVDSISMLELVEFIEEIIGREIDLSGEFLEKFTTMRTVYNSYIKGVAVAAPDVD